MSKRDIKLTNAEVKLFYRLYFDLLSFANLKYGSVPSIKVIDPVKGISPADAQKIKAPLWANPKTVDEYLSRKDLTMPAEERAIIEGWGKRFIDGKFFIMKQLTNYAVFMYSSREKKGLYAVAGLYTHIDQMFPKEALPHMANATLLPFLGRIISDGAYSSYNITFGSGMRRNLMDEYREIKEKHGITTSL